MGWEMKQTFDRQMKLVGSLKSAEVNPAEAALTRAGWSDTLLQVDMSSALTPSEVVYEFERI